MVAMYSTSEIASTLFIEGWKSGCRDDGRGRRRGELLGGGRAGPGLRAGQGGGAQGERDHGAAGGDQDDRVARAQGHQVGPRREAERTTKTKPEKGSWLS